MNKQETKTYLERSRGYKIRSLKLRSDGNWIIYLKKPLPTGITVVTVTTKMMEV